MRFHWLGRVRFYDIPTIEGYEIINLKKNGGACGVMVIVVGKWTL